MSPSEWLTCPRCEAKLVERWPHATDLPWGRLQNNTARRMLEAPGQPHWLRIAAYGWLHAGPDGHAPMGRGELRSALSKAIALAGGGEVPREINLAREIERAVVAGMLLPGSSVRCLRTEVTRGRDKGRSCLVCGCGWETSLEHRHARKGV